MDTNALYSCFEATTSGNPTTLPQAEQQLKEVEKLPGFIHSCLDIVREPQASDNVRKAASVYLKNIVTRNWNPHGNKMLIREEEKPQFREKLVPTLISVSGAEGVNSLLRSQLVAMLAYIVVLDYPKQWSSLLAEAENLLASSSDQDKFTGVLILTEITKRYRYMTGDSRLHLDEIIQRTFGTLLLFGQSLVSQDSFYAGDMLRHILKMYKYATYYKLPAALQSDNSLRPWAELHINCITRTLPQEVLGLDLEDRELHPWTKCQKWGYANLYRMFHRYGTESLVAAEYEAFSARFNANYVPEILRAYFGQIEGWAKGSIWISNKSLYRLVNFLEDCIRVRENWPLVKDHIDTIVRHVVFPLMCLTENDLEAFEDEPVEYIHRRIDVYDENPTADMAATSFLITLIEKRPSCLPSVLQLVQETVQANGGSGDLQEAIKRESALRMLGSISHLIIMKKKNAQFREMIEPFLVQYVVPDFGSPHGFMRARACEMVNSFADIDFQDQSTVQALYSHVLTSLGDQHLPVRAEAALALQPLIQIEDVRVALAENITAIMQQLLQLSDEIELDAISAVMENFVDSFSEQLAPFAVQLATQLRDQFMRIATELCEKKNPDPDSDEGFDFYQDEDKTLAAEGILNTIITLVLAMDNSAESIIAIEEVLMPVYKLVLEQGLVEFLSAVFELIEDTTFCIKAISPHMWSIFGTLSDTFVEHAMDFIEELHPVLENYMNYGADQLRQNPEYLAKIWHIIESVLTEGEGRLSWQEKKYACELIQALVLNFHGHVDIYVERIVKHTVDILTSDPPADEPLKPVFRLYLMENILSCLIYNPIATISMLQQLGFTEAFFSAWFESMEQFVRVNDKKLIALALLAVIANATGLPQSLQQNLPQLFQGLVSVMKTLPAAEKHKEELSKEFDPSMGGDLSQFANENFDYDDEAFNAEDLEEGEDDGEDEDEEYAQLLRDEDDRLISGAFRFDEGDTVEEEALGDFATDSVNMYAQFKQQVEALQQSNAGLYQSLVSSLDADMVKVVEDVYQRADAPPRQ